MNACVTNALLCYILCVFQGLLTSTLLLVVAVFTILVTFRAMGKARVQQGVFVAVYLLLFAYPVVSVKICEAFAW
jgi:hypothetical protein